VALVLVAVALLTSATAVVSQAPQRAPDLPDDLRVEAPPPPFSDGIFPCSNCHAEMKPDRTRRELVAMHDDIQLKHDEEHRWCLDCHDADNRDVLHLANGDRVPFEESYRVCGQCHGEKYRDWRAGVHGRRVGEWNGHKNYLLCPHCHNPHQPRFKALQPQPAPRRPRTGRR
jgi:Zn finger protein HypA/HybF involved in hydrogenase expression